MNSFYPKLRSVQIKTGIWTLAIGVILLFSYLWLSNRLNMKASYELKISFSDVNGLEVGDKVVFRGMEVGRVKAIKSQGDAVLVLGGVDSQIRLNQGSEFKVMDSGLMGSKVLAIVPGAGKERLDITRIQQGTSPDGLMSMVSQASETLATLQSSLDALQAPDGLLTGSAKLVKNADNAVQNSQSAAMELKQEISAVIARVDKLTAGLNIVVQENSDTVNRSIAETPAMMKKINGTLDSLQVLSGNLSKTAQQLQSGDGTAAKLLNDDELYTKLGSSLENLDALIQDIKAHPKKYVKFSLF